MNMKLFRLLAVSFALAMGMAACSDDETAPADAPEQELDFAVRVSDISAVMATVTVEPRDAAMTYYWDVLDDADFQTASDKGIDHYLQWMLEKRLMGEWQLNFPEAIALMTSQGKDGSTVTGLEPGSKYHALAVGIDSEGFATTEVVSVEFSTLDPIVSQNTFRITVADASHGGARIEVETSNDDPYFLEVVPVDETADPAPTGEELAETLLNRYLTWGGMADLCHTGDYGYTEEGCKPGWSYRVVVFGYDGGMITTAVETVPFTTLSGGDPASCDFRFDYTFSTYSYSQFTYEPSDDRVVYMADLIEESYYQLYLNQAGGDREKAMNEVLNRFIETYSVDFSTRMETVDMISSFGELTLDINVEAETEYRMWAVCVDQQGNPAAPFVLSEVFRTPEKRISTAALSLAGYTWYDGDELFRSDPETFAGARGYAVLALSLEPSSDAAHWYCYAFYGDLTESSERNVVNNLLRAGTETMDATEMLIVCYWGENTVCGVALDEAGDYGPILKQVVDLTKEGASPVPSTLAARSLRMLPAAGL